MFNLFAALKKDKLWDFKGGIHPPEMKHPSSHVPLRHVSLPPMLIIPVQQHIGPEGELLVKVGQHVMKGQPLTRGTGRIGTAEEIAQLALYLGSSASGWILTPWLPA